MSVIEIVSSVLLLLSGIAIILFVLAQESKGRGLSGVMGSGEMVEDNRSRFGGSLLAKYTKYAGIVFFVLAILVNIGNVYFSK